MKSLIGLAVIVLLPGCDSDCHNGGNWEDFVRAPIVMTSKVINLTDSSTVSGAYEVYDEGALIIEKGIEWFSDEDTTRYRTNEGVGSYPYTSTMAGLRPNTRYHVLAYAVNRKGTGHGAEKTITTLKK